MANPRRNAYYRLHDLGDHPGFCPKAVVKERTNDAKLTLKKFRRDFLAMREEMQNLNPSMRAVRGGFASPFPDSFTNKAVAQRILQIEKTMDLTVKPDGEEPPQVMGFVAKGEEIDYFLNPPEEVQDAISQGIRDSLITNSVEAVYQGTNTLVFSYLFLKGIFSPWFTIPLFVVGDFPVGAYRSVKNLIPRKSDFAVLRSAVEKQDPNTWAYLSWNTQIYPLPFDIMRNMGRLTPEAVSLHLEHEFKNNVQRYRMRNRNSMATSDGRKISPYETIYVSGDILFFTDPTDNQPTLALTIRSSDKKMRPIKSVVRETKLVASPQQAPASAFAPATQPARRR